ncbi:MAG: hypothetical protein KAY59_01580 [Acidobacteria bacterium]|nr:hypothetical protein [Acidobacteriota bacterium]
MLFQPAIIALLVASTINAAVVIGVLPFAVSILRHWNLASGSQRQLALERRTYLVSTIVALVLGVQLIALLLYIFNADRMSTMFVGAMCAVGTLTVNTYGFPALFAQVAVFFSAAVWLAVNHTDIQAPDYPLVRTKYALLLGLAPLLVAASALQWRYFLGLHADVITSCCSRLFASSARGVSADLAAWPPLPAMIAFYSSIGAATLTAAWVATRRRGGYLLALTSLIAGVVGVAGIVAFVSVYVYEQPFHHCPFCLLKSDYGYIGYALYIPLFGATASGLSAGAIQRFARVPTLRDIVPAFCARLARWSALGFATVAIVATIIILRSHLILIGSTSTGVTP